MKCSIMNVLCELLCVWWAQNMLGEKDAAADGLWGNIPTTAVTTAAQGFN